MSRVLAVALLAVTMSSPCEAYNLRALARNYIDIFGKAVGSDAEASEVAALLDEDYTFDVSPSDAVPENLRQGNRDRWVGLVSTFQALFQPGFRFVIDDIVVGRSKETGRSAIVYMHAENSFLRANGLPYNQIYVYRLWFREGKLLRQSEFLDSLLITQRFFPDILRERCPAPAE